MRAFCRWLRTFFVADPIALELRSLQGLGQLLAQEERKRVDADGQALLIRGLGEIHKGTADNVAYFADHRPKGYAWTFEKREK